MSKVLAIYEYGVFKPEEPVNLVPGTRVELILPDARMSPSELLRRRYPNILYVPDEDAREMTRIVEEELGQMNPNEPR
jgi:predicted DNA-binding antitoxin AbrB/MazE fold protein